MGFGPSFFLLDFGPPNHAKTHYLDIHYIQYNEFCVLQISGTIILKYSVYYLDTHYIVHEEFHILKNIWDYLGNIPMTPIYTTCTNC
jgi:hypothetical protein